MFRRRPLARMAVRTTLVAGTAVAVGATVGRAVAGPPQQAAPAPEAAAPAPAPVAAPAAPVADPIEQLTQLAALKNAGVLTDAEFETQKAKILG